MNNKVIVIGAGGHSKVITDIIEKCGDYIYGYLDDSKAVNEIIYKNYKNLGKVSDCIRYQEQNHDIKFIIAIGDNNVRKKIYNEYELNYYTAIHPNAIIAGDVTIGTGTAIMANVCINADTIIGENCIINTATIIEHENRIENNVHISTNAIVCGGVVIGEGAYIGAGAIIKRCVTIGADSKVDEGTVVG